MYFAFILEHLCFSSEFSAVIINFVYLSNLVNYMCWGRRHTGVALME